MVGGLQTKNRTEGWGPNFCRLTHKLVYSSLLGTGPNTIKRARVISRLHSAENQSIEMETTATQLLQERVYLNIRS